jgi:hypothetical protein
MFWTTVDLLGLRHYFRNVARHKQRLDAAAGGGREQGPEGQGAAGVDVGEEAEAAGEEGQGLALMLHSIERGSEWGVHR